MAGLSQETLLGRIAVQAGMLTLDQLAEATRAQGRQGTQNLGDIFVDKGFLTPEELQRLVQLQKNVLARMAQKRREQAGEAPAARPAARTQRPAAGTAAAPPVKPSAAPTEAARPGPEAPATEPAARVAAGGALDSVLREAVSLGASDLHVHAGAPLKLRVHEDFVDRGDCLDAAAAERLVLEALSPEERALLDERGEIDFCYSLQGLGRFRGNAYRQLRGTDATFRVIPERIPSLDDLGLPNTLARFTNYHQGMVLVTGPTRCGKTSTLAALVNMINEERAEHILTIEDPIEFLHPSKRCIVNQRHVLRHTESFARALRAALREDPDVIVIGELRDTETISLALTAAETGHFVLATLHTDGAIRTIDRLVGAFPPEQQEQIRTMVSESLRAVISQKLVAKADGNGQAAALEILIANRAVGKIIRDNKTFQLGSTLQTGVAQGMCLLDHSLAQLASSGVITRDEALRHCANPKLISGGPTQEPDSGRAGPPTPRSGSS